MDEKRNYRGEASELLDIIARKKVRVKFLIGMYVFNTFPKDEKGYAVAKFSDYTSWPYILDLQVDEMVELVAVRADEHGNLQFNDSLSMEDENEVNPDTWFDEYDDYLVDYEMLLGVLQNAEAELTEGK